MTHSAVRLPSARHVSTIGGARETEVSEFTAMPWQTAWAVVVMRATPVVNPPITSRNAGGLTASPWFESATASGGAIAGDWPPSMSGDCPDWTLEGSADMVIIPPASLPPAHR